AASLDRSHRRPNDAELYRTLNTFAPQLLPPAHTRRCPHARRARAEDTRTTDGPRNRNCPLWQSRSDLPDCPLNKGPDLRSFGSGPRALADGFSLRDQKKSV